LKISPVEQRRILFLSNNRSNQKFLWLNKY